MNAFIIEIANRPGELARIAATLGEAGVNISTGAGIGLATTGGFGFLTDDEAAAKRALDSAGISYRTVGVVTVNVADQPGGLASVARRLADANVNIEFVIPTSTGATRSVAIGVEDASAAGAALGDLAG